MGCYVSQRIRNSIQLFANEGLYAIDGLGGSGSRSQGLEPLNIIACEAGRMSQSFCKSQKLPGHMQASRCVLIIVRVKIQGEREPLE